MYGCRVLATYCLPAAQMSSSPPARGTIHSTLRKAPHIENENAPRLSSRIVKLSLKCASSCRLPSRGTSATLGNTDVLRCLRLTSLQNIIRSCRVKSSPGLCAVFLARTKRSLGDSLPCSEGHPVWPLCCCQVDNPVLHPGASLTAEAAVRWYRN